MAFAHVACPTQAIVNHEASQELTLTQFGAFALLAPAAHGWLTLFSTQPRVKSRKETT
jgi:hypothetical protein